MVQATRGAVGLRHALMQRHRMRTRPTGPSRQRITAAHIGQCGAQCQVRHALERDSAVMCGAIFPKQTVVFVRIAGSLSVCEAHAVGTRVRYSEGLTLRHCTRRLAVSSIG